MKLKLWQWYVRRFCTRKINGDMKLPGWAEWLYDNWIDPDLEKWVHVCEGELRCSFRYDPCKDWTHMKATYKGLRCEFWRTRYDWEKDPNRGHVMIEASRRLFEI